MRFPTLPRELLQRDGRTLFPFWLQVALRLCVGCSARPAPPPGGEIPPARVFPGSAWPRRRRVDPYIGWTDRGV